MAGDNANELRATLIFHGETGPGPHPKDHITAADFCREINDRKRRYEWTELKTLGVFTASLRDEAQFWHKSTVLGDLSAEEEEEIAVNWTTALQPLFKEFFNVDNEIKGIDWPALYKQRPNEGAVAYCNRVYHEVTKHTEGAREYITPPVMDADGLAAIAGLDAAIQTRINNSFVKLLKKRKTHAQRSFISHTTRGILASGLTLATLRQRAQDFNLLPTSAASKFGAFVKMIIDQEVLNAKNKGANGGLTRLVSAVDDEDYEDDLDLYADEEEIAAFRLAKKKAADKKKKKENKDKGNTGSGSGGGKKKCNYCGYPNHTESECNHKKRNMKELKEKSGGGNKKSGGAAPPTTTPAFAINDTNLSQHAPNFNPPRSWISGNENGSW